MNFDLTEEQKLLKESARNFLSRECPRDLVRTLEEGREFPPELWRKMIDLGWTGLIIPVEYGGSGASFLDLAILFEEIGYHICPSPLFATVVLGALPVMAWGTPGQKEDLLPKIAGGERIMTLAVDEPGAYRRAASIATKASAAGDGFVIDGTKLFVPDADRADLLLCAARTGGDEEDITLFIVEKDAPGITVTPLQTLTGDRQFEVVFSGVPVGKERILGEPDRAWPIVEDIQRKATVVLCAEMIGGAQAVMDMSLEYARERTQFNRPIGSFQAIQHHFANMLADISGSRYLFLKAAWKISEGRDASMDAAMAKARVGEAYRRVTILGHQIFGGIGFTKEHDMYLYHEHSMTGDLKFGGADLHRARVADELGL